MHSLFTVDYCPIEKLHARFKYLVRFLWN